VLLQVVHGGEHHAGRGVARQALVVVLLHVLEVNAAPVGMESSRSSL
jgi:hypothetical protein